MSFWKRTLQIFSDAAVRVEYRSAGIGARSEAIADIETIGDTSCTFKKSDGSLLVVPFLDLLVVEPAVGRL